MEACILPLFISAVMATRPMCDRSKMPIELGHWARHLLHMDTATIENPPVTVIEGQIYVYENYFPNYTIKYIHVDNLAIRSCGASATLKAGGVGTSGVLIVLTSGPYQEIRTVIDIWGSRNQVSKPAKSVPAHLKELKSAYLFKGVRAVNHNHRNSTLI